MTTIIDTDKSGHGFQKQKVWLGPSLGWAEEYVQPSTLITTGPTYAVQPGDGMLLIDVPAGITINLPDVKAWFQQVANQPATGWNRQICVKDFGGNAEIGNIVIQPFGSQRIDEHIGTTAITINNSVLLLVPNIDLSGWVIAAGTTGVLIPVGTFLPVHDPNATGKLTVREIGGDILALQGGAAGSQSVTVSADDASVDGDVNIHLIPKNAGGVLMYSNHALQVAVSGSAGNNKFIALTGGSPGLNPSISSSFGGPIDVRDSVRVGPIGGNRGTVAGSDPGQQAIIYGVDPASPDADVNIHLIPKNSGGTLLYANNALQMAVSGPPNTTEYLVVSGANGLDDPLIANASGQPIRLDSAILVGPGGGNFAGLYGSAGGGQAVSLRADNASNPDTDINIHIIPKGNAATILYSNNSGQAIVNGPANTTSYVDLSGGVAGSNPTIQAAFTTAIDIFNANLTGVPHAPTAVAGTSTTQVASTAFVMNTISGGGSFLPLTGGTITGDLVISKTQPGMSFNFATGSAALFASRAQATGNFRWQFIIADGSPETGSPVNVGSNFRIDRYGDAGDFLGTPMTIQRHDGTVILRKVAIQGTPTIALQFNPGSPAVLASQTMETVPKSRWLIALGDGAPETGSNAGSNFAINRYADDGTLLGQVMSVNRATGAVNIPNLAGGGGAPTDAEYITSTTNGLLTSERVLTDTASVTWDRTTPGQIKATAIVVGGGGNVSSSGTIQVGQLAVWDSPTTIQSMSTATAGIAPGSAEYIVGTAHANLSNERVLTDTATITWDRTTAGQVKANAVGGGGGSGNVSSSGTPAAFQFARWTDATHIEGLSPAATLVQIGAQPNDQQLTALANLAPTANDIPYFTTAATMDSFTSNSFSRGMFAASSAATWRSAIGAAPLDSPIFTGTPQAPTTQTSQNDTTIATTAFVKTVAGGYTLKAGDTMTGNLTINKVHPALILNKTSASGQMNNIEGQTNGSTRWLMRLGESTNESGGDAGSDFAILRYSDTAALLGNPILISRATGQITFALTGPTPIAPTPAAADNSQKLATTAFVKAQGYQTSSDVAAGFQPLDADLTSIAAATGTNNIYYRSAGGWQSVAIGTGLGFTGGILSVTASYGDVFLAGTNVFTNNNTFRGLGPTVEALTGGGASQTWTNYQNAAGSPNLQIRHSRGTTYGAQAAVAVSDPLGTISFQGSDGAGFVTGAQIFTFVDAAPVSGHIQSSLRFYVDDGVTTLERARIDKGGITSAWRGVTDGLAGAAGDVGEYKEAILGAASTPTVSVVTPIFGLALTAGDWDVWTNVGIIPAAAGGMELELSTTTGFAGFWPTYQIHSFFAAGGFNAANFGPFRFSSAVPITVTLVVRAGAAGQQVAKGLIAARRRR